MFCAACCAPLALALDSLTRTEPIVKSRRRGLRQLLRRCCWQELPAEGAGRSATARPQRGLLHPGPAPQKVASPLSPKVRQASGGPVAPKPAGAAHMPAGSAKGAEVAAAAPGARRRRQRRRLTRHTSSGGQRPPLMMERLQHYPSRCRDQVS